MTGAIRDEETFDLRILKFLETAGVSSQRELEQAVAKAIAAGTIGGTETMVAPMRLQIPVLQLGARFDAEVKLQQPLAHKPEPSGRSGRHVDFSCPHSSRIDKAWRQLVDTMSPYLSDPW